MQTGNLNPGGCDKETFRGQAVYTRRGLLIYDFLVLRLSNSLIWKCPTRILLKMFRQHVSSNHLDIGVGTGYFLQHCSAADGTKFTLLDLNQNSLSHAAMRIKGYSPETVEADVLKPLPLGDRKFGSVSLNYLLHCIPGTLAEKCCVFDHIVPHMNQQATVFGSTLLNKGEQLNLAARKLMKLYNSKGIFHNESDSYDDLERELNSRFNDVSLRKVGGCALFILSDPVT